MTADERPGGNEPVVEPRPAADSGRPGLLGSLLVLGSVVLGAIGLAVVPGLDLGGAADEAAAAAVTTTTQVVPDECSEAHAAHNEAMWDPTSADEMVDAGCPWPYEPFLTAVDGGAENLNLAAPFEPRRYSEVWDALQDADFGVCAVTALPEPAGDGFVFGFRYDLRAGACDTGEADVALLVREHASRGWRDAAALDLGDTQPVLVLGRWTLIVDVLGGTATTDGASTADSASTADDVYAVLVGLGGVTAGGPGA